MKKSLRIFKIFLFLLMMMTTQDLLAQLKGAWHLKDGDTNHLLLIEHNFIFHTIYKDNEFINLHGGTFERTEKELVINMLVHNLNADAVGKKTHLPYTFLNDELTLMPGNKILKFKRVDSGNAPLAGVWRITSRMQADGKVVPIHQTGTRVTYKILTSSKFQWLAIDPAVKLFNGTGGGSYTFKDGKYVETIEFFSRDNNRVGASLSFDGKLENGDWHHSGLSSKGEKIYEIWSQVK
ncbi:hypothetical protein [Pedobacter glucosidilyticus]|uniref:hypothetical protein n=1 Tax=Pedobacter glucosidilyticus TaxID=1122941 RepID=UPI0026ED3622|nr:hypothetical protein [Pedobacter glucosidilyticus]